AVTPKYVRNYKMMPHAKQETERQIKEMLENNIISEDNGSWFTPVMLIKKPSGDYRLIADLRTLNKNVEPSVSWPLPTFEECVDLIADKKEDMQRFAMFDFFSGFNQVELEPQSRQYTAFVGPNQQKYHYNRLAQGFVHSPSRFCMELSKCFMGINMVSAVIYVDDVLTWSKRGMAHIEAVRKIFERCRQYNFKLSAKKCSFYRKSVKFLGVILSEDGLSIDPNRIYTVQKYPRPKNHKELRSFIGLITYNRGFIENCSKLVAPLTQLLKKSEETFRWTQEAEDSFIKLKEALTNAVKLAIPNNRLPYIIETDCSRVASAWTLKQWQDGVLRVISYGGRRLTQGESNLSAGELELLAVITCLSTNRGILNPEVEHTLYSDHMTLTFINNLKYQVNKLFSWSL